MANTGRRVKDSDGKQFLPMNVEGSFGEDSPMTFTKVITTIVVLATLVVSAIVMIESGFSIAKFCILYGAMFIAGTMVIRYFVLEERTYYRMYKEAEENTNDNGEHIIDAKKIWNIASIDNSEDGAKLIFKDAKVGVVVRIERGVITGHREDSVEKHTDCVSEFYKELNKRNICHVHMSIMEPAGKDSRLNKLDRLGRKSDNKNINRLAELGITHIKNISQSTWLEAEYYLLYTRDITRVDMINQDVEECMAVLMKGMYAGYEVLGSGELRGLNEFVKERMSITQFNIREASIGESTASIEHNSSIVNIREIVWSTGDRQELSYGETKLLLEMASEAIRCDKIRIEESLKSTLYKKIDKKEFEVDIEEIRDTYREDEIIDF